MISSTKILCIGAVMVDLVCQMPAFPRPGQGMVAERVEEALGGCAFNNARVISQFGLECFLMAPVGSGLYADFIRRRLRECGIQAFETHESMDNGACMCVVDPSGERTMLTMPGIDRHFKSEWFASIRPDDFNAAIVGGYEVEGEGGEAIIGFLEDNPHLTLYYAPGPRINGIGALKTKRINALRPIWHLNDQEAFSYTGLSNLEDAARAIFDECENAVVITAGSEGSCVYDGDRFEFVRTEPVDAVDTVGAGDAHVASIAASRCAGYSWTEALSFANKVSGAVCAVSGATLSDEEFRASSLPTLK